MKSGDQKIHMSIVIVIRSVNASSVSLRKAETTQILSNSLYTRIQNLSHILIIQQLQHVTSHHIPHRLFRRLTHEIEERFVESAMRRSKLGIHVTKG